jgi:hypothetical protein
MKDSVLKPLCSDLILYRWVQKELSLPIARDMLSPIFGLILFKPRKDWYRLDKIIEREVYVIGAGPSLEYHLNIEAVSHDKPIICADGAVGALIERDIFPDIIVTDLDGSPSALKEAYDNGSIFVVLCHGDNIDRQIYFADMTPEVYITSQVYSAPPFIVNIGGFTDGDRAVHLAARYGAKTIYLVGMEFGGAIGKYSFGFPKDLDRKRRKLRIGKILLERAARIYGLKLINITAETRLLKK